MAAASTAAGQPSTDEIPTGPAADVALRPDARDTAGAAVGVKLPGGRSLTPRPSTRQVGHHFTYLDQGLGP